MRDTERLFVYGSLQPGGTNAHILEEYAGSWSAARVRGKLLQTGWGASIGYPGLVLDAGGDAIDGFVLSSSELSAAWERLDEFEGEDYERQRAPVTLRNGETVSAFVYVLKRHTADEPDAAGIP